MPQLFANNAKSTLAAAILSGATSMTVATGDGAKFPAVTAGNYFLATLAAVTGATETAWEIVSVTARTGDVFTIVRAQEGTTAAGWAISTPVELRLTASTMTTLVNASVPPQLLYALGVI